VPKGHKAPISYFTFARLSDAMAVGFKAQQNERLKRPAMIKIRKVAAAMIIVLRI
jgi:hypothetical protein